MKILFDFFYLWLWFDVLYFKIFLLKDRENFVFVGGKGIEEFVN